MKPSDVLDIVIHSILFNRRIMVCGEPGCSKTETIKSAVKIIREVALGNLKTGKYYDAIILKNASYWASIGSEMQHPVMMEPVDNKGFPFVNKDGKADFIPFAILEKMIETKTPLVIFYDDLGLGNSSIQGSIMQIILERNVNGKKISDHVRFVAATNRRKDNAGVGNIITPLLNRFDSIINMELSATDWCKWAMKNNMPVELVSFINFKPDMLSTFKAEKDIKAFASPRSLEFLGRWINEGVTYQNYNSPDVKNNPNSIKNDSVFEVWQGCVGEAFAIEFCAFYSVYKNIVHIPEQVFNHPNKAEVPTKPDIIYALTGVLSKRANDVNIDNLFVYMDRLPFEYQVVLVSNLTASKPELINCMAFVNWSVNNKDKI